MYCKHCGNRIDDDSVFCANCGKTVSGGERSGFLADSQRKSRAGGSFLKKFFYGVGAFACALPVPVAEYRRIVHGEFGVQYWLLCAPIVLSCLFLYLLLSEGPLREEKARVEKAKRSGERYEDKTSKIRTNILSLCCLVAAVVGFGSGIVVNLIF